MPREFSLGNTAIWHTSSFADEFYDGFLEETLVEQQNSSIKSLVEPLAIMSMVFDKVVRNSMESASWSPLDRNKTQQVFSNGYCFCFNSTVPKYFVCFVSCFLGALSCS